MQEITFWNLIKSDSIQKICIPTIQRDYAQGRRDKVYLRNNFLSALKNAIITKKTLTLDFVYGVENETMFIPLDGQQRLTTLWLLHWFIAYKAGTLDKAEIKNNLMKFSYETRISSTDFCKSLCSLAPNATDKNLREWITQQTWFFHQYKQDPTIMGMLNMIAGTDITDKYGEDILDGLEEIFKDEECNYLSLWETLTTTECIKFNKLHICLQDSDELYVKMNARGKQLTDFENFKTELVQHSKDSCILGETGALELAAKLDVQWTDIFWKNKWEDPKTKDISIDEIYFAFIIRFTRLECIKKYGDDSKLIKKISKTFTSFDPYLQILDRNSIKDFISIMDNLRGNGINTNSPWGEKFDFIPRYMGEKKTDITSTTNTELLLFYGYCRYFLIGEYDEKSFSEWNRVLWNICENRVEKSKFRPTITEIDLLAPSSHHIINFLSQEETIKCEYNKEQLLEEQRKARQLSKNPEIINMEKYSFFHGAIRFLFTGPNKEEDWKSFETKAKNITELIPEDISKRHTIKLLTPYISQKALGVIYYHHWASNNNEDLRAILLDERSVPYIHNFLLKNDEKENTILHQDIIDICEIAYGGKGYLQTYWNNEGEYIWTNYERKGKYYKWSSYIIGNENYMRISKILDNSILFEIHKDQYNRRIGDHIQALFLNFKYKKHSFTLFGNNTICMMTEYWEEKLSKEYYFSIENIETEYDLIQNIDTLIKSV